VCPTDASVALAVAGRIDICVNNAGMIAVGIEPRSRSTTDVSDDEWSDSLHRNLTTCFAVTRVCINPMRERRYGRIVNVASTSGPVQAFLGDPGYHAAKAGIIGLTRAVALEVAGDGITVNAVSPGWIATGAQLTIEHTRVTRPRRSGTPDEVAAALRFSPTPASFVTAQQIVVDGGNSLPGDPSSDAVTTISKSRALPAAQPLSRQPTMWRRIFGRLELDHRCRRCARTRSRGRPRFRGWPRRWRCSASGSRKEEVHRFRTLRSVITSISDDPRLMDCVCCDRPPTCRCFATARSGVAPYESP
jgi:hypothetical protein